MGFKWERSPTDVFPEMTEKYTTTRMLSGRRVAEQRAEDATQWMRAEAPWQDRTGRARAGLHVEVKESPGVLAELVFSHDPSLDYPVYLETKDGGKFAIIAPAIDYWGPILMRDLQRIMNLGLATRD